MNKILYGILIVCSLSVSYLATAQTQTVNEKPTNSTSSTGSTNHSDDCSNPEKRASRDSTCVSGSALATAKQITPSSMGNTKIIMPYQNCTTPWGATVSDGGTVQAFLASSGATCSEETRYCMSGTLSGSYQYQSCTTGPTCGPVNQVESGSCPAGYTGTRSRTNVVDTCTNNVTSYGAWDNSTCTVDSSAGCPWYKTAANATVGTIAPTCDVSGSGPNPQGQTYQCQGDGSWNMYNSGNSAIMMNCI